MAPQKQVREIEIRVNTRGNSEIKKLASEFGALNKGVRDFNGTMNTLKNAFAAISAFTFAGIGIRELVGTADAMQKLTDRLTLSEGSIDAANSQLLKLGDVANHTQTSIEDVATVYSRLNLSLRDAGVGSEALLATTQALQNTFRLSGTTAAEATAATIQLSQGLASGQVRGQELRSVLEQNALMGEILAKKLGIARGELLKFAEKNGGIKASVVLGAIADNFKDIEERASKLKPTIGEAVTTSFNKLKISLNELNQEFGLSQKVITGVSFAAENLGTILGSAALLGSIYIITKAVAGLTVAFEFLTTAGAALAFFGSATVTAALSAVLVPLGIIVGTLGSLYLAIFKANEMGEFFSKTITGIKETFLEWKDAITGSADSAKSIQAINDKLLDTEKRAGQAKALLADISGTNFPMRGIFDENESPIERQINALKNAAKAIDENKKLVFDFKKELGLLNTKYQEGGISVREYSNRVRELEIKNLNQEFSEGSFTLTDYNKRLKEIMDGKAVKNSKLLELNLKQLNAEFFAGKMSIEQYSSALQNAELDKLSRDVEQGKNNILDFNTAVRKGAIQELNKELAAGLITIKQYQYAIGGTAVEQLNEELRTGVITLEQYDQSLSKISDKFSAGSALRNGMQDYLNSSGTFAENVAKGIENTFNRLEDYMFDFMKTGKFEFRKFAQAILDDINKIIIRALIVRPIANGILNSLPGADVNSVHAKGGVFGPSGIQPFASGGVVSSPTLFGYGGGKTGLMGEKGHEGILPLKRTANGDLGVQSTGGGSGAVIVNVYNQGSGEAEVTQQERTNSNGDRVLDVIIRNKVKQSMSDGSLDSIMKMNYGVQRRSS